MGMKEMGEERYGGQERKGKHSHFQTPLENPSIQTHLVLLCCIKRICIFGPKDAIQIRYYYYYYYYFFFNF